MKYFYDHHGQLLHFKEYSDGYDLGIALLFLPRVPI